MGFEVNIFRLIILACLCAIMVSCASQESVRKDVKVMQKAPSTPPTKTITNFSDGLRCMDNKLIEYGVRDIAILLEDLEDRTTKVNAGTKDMLITAISDMTRRSRAIKVIAFGNDSGNLVSFLAQAGSQNPYNVLPQYDIRGSISQLDSSVVRKQEDASFVAKNFGVGPSRSHSGSVLGLDLSVLSTEDMSVIPGVTSSNSVIIFKSGEGLYGDATIKGSGLSYSFLVNKNEGTVQALRNLVELATIELVGRLVHVPYWKCTGVPESSIEVRQEVEDWYYSMKAHGELIPFIEFQLRNRGYDTGARSLDDIKLAIETFNARNGGQEKADINQRLFELLLNGGQADGLIAREGLQEAPRYVEGLADKPGITSEQLNALNTKSEKPQSNKSSMPLDIALTSVNGRSHFSPGELIQVELSLSESGYAYCYFEDEDKNIQRFFPNRFHQDNYLTKGNSLTLPGNLPFDMVASASGKTEKIHCFAATENLYHQLPVPLKTHDFETLSVRTINALTDEFDKAGNGVVAQISFEIKVN